MIRELTAALLLRTTGASVQFTVRRILDGNVRGKGSTVLTTPKYREAIAKYKAMRIADTDTITVTVEAIIKQRHGTIESKGEHHA